MTVTTRRAAYAVALAAIVPFVHTLGHGFAYDDGAEVTTNAFIRSLDAVPEIFRRPSWAGAGVDAQAYRPVTTLTYALNHAAGGLHPFGYHLVNLLLHACASVLVLALLLEAGLALPAAALSAAVFAVLPAHVEAVANVAGRKELLVTVFALATALLHRRALRRGGGWLVAAPLAALAAAGSKETGLVVIGLVALGDVLLDRDACRSAPRRCAALYASYVAGIVAFLLARWSVLHTLAMPGTSFLANPIADAPAAQRFATAVVVLAKGLQLLVAPVTLSPDYSYAALLPVKSALEPRLVASVAALGVVLALAVWPGPARRLRLAAAAWYAIAIFPGSNLLVPIGTIFGERLLYLPSVAFAAAVGALGARWVEASRGRLPPAVVAVALALLAFRGAWYARAWADDLTIFTEGKRVQPESAKMYLTSGGYFLVRGAFPEAAASFRRAAEILEGHPADQATPLVQLGTAYEQMGRGAEAEPIYLAVLGRDPADATALWRLGVLRWGGGDRAEAVRLWRRAAASKPGYAPALSDLGLAAYLSGDLAAAEASLRQATASAPDMPGAWDKLALVLERQGRAAEAAEARRRYLELAPAAQVHRRAP